jgi:hypothetical protein
MADDLNSEFVLKITKEVTFGYGDSRIVTGREARNYECCVMAFIGSVPPEGEIDSIAFVAGTTK